MPAMLVITLLRPAVGELAATDTNEQKETSADSGAAHSFGGPTSVDAQIEADKKARETTPYRFGGLAPYFEPYWDFKNQVKADHGLAFGGDYTFQYQGASRSLGEEDNAAGGVARFFGNWALINRGTADAGSLVFKVENRHRVGTDIAPQALGPEIGYAGLTSAIWSDAGSLLTNLYWQQGFDDNRFAFVAGIVDVTDYFDLYALINPWTDFGNLVFLTSPTIPAPSQGLGAAARANFADHYYVIAGLGDANGDPSNTNDSISGFFDDHEYFKHIEIGWFPSWAQRYTDNIHVGAWHVDERDAAQVEDGWGMTFSVCKMLRDHWLPFVRAGYADGGGALLERSVSAGLGYFWQDRADVTGIGLSWGRPNEDLFGPDLEDQYTAEAYWRIQFMKHVTVTPSIQLLIDPALYPEANQLCVFGVMARLMF